MAAAVVGVVLITFLAAGLSDAPQPARLPTEKTVAQPLRIYQPTDPNLLVPESTMRTKREQYPHYWDDNPVAYIPESTMYEDR